MKTRNLTDNKTEKPTMPLNIQIILSAKKFNDLMKNIGSNDIINDKQEKMLYDAAEISESNNISIINCTGKITPIGKLLLDRAYTQARHELTCFDAPTKNQLDFIEILELLKDGELQKISNDEMETRLIRRNSIINC